MNKNLLFFSLNLLYFQANAQFELDLSSWDASTITQVRKASYNPLCPKKSNEVVLCVNLARMDGQKFVDAILRPYLEYTGDSAYSEYLQSLISQLNSKRNQKPLKHDLWLEMMAKSYALRE